ncbi:MAG TPA: chromosome segregation protein SMC [Acidimicrobiia bacterium]|nr:chromosome segregation protein SMC [Acidimicrobiia bacterium]
MFLKSLTLKGFKSFADKTTLDFEPGVCVVVGPNGSGKSNVVDSVAWVLGAQGARALRGGKMDDVIFAGTADRPALGRAEVSLTIDNSSHLLPIEFSEVTITRTLFRSGESEYMINGAPCRLLDIQELLSDTGIGRQQHVIVGQGQLDTVLNARPEDRRAIIEEAAGILKFRKRKEKAERRLEATEGNLLRLTDLLREVRRQLRPLERQADAARRHDGIVDELNSVRLHLAGREIDQLRAREGKRADARRDLAEQEQDVRVRLRALDSEVLDAEHALAVPGDDDVADLLARTEALRERSRGLVNLVSERLRGMEREFAAVADEGVVESLVAEAAQLRSQLTAVDQDFATLAPSRADVDAAEARVAALADGPSLGDAEAAAQSATRDVEELRQRESIVERELDDARSALARVDADRAALAPAIAETEAAESAAASARAEIDARAAVASELSEEHREVAAAEDAVQAADATWREAEAEASRWRARAETLALALEEAHAAAGGDELADLEGVLGPLVDLLEIDEGVEIAVAAALGDALKAIVVDGDAAARAAIERLKRGDRQALLLVAEGRAHGVQISFAPEGTRPLGACVRGLQPGLDPVLARLFAPFVLVDGGWEQALDVALANPGLIAVTREGDRFGGPSSWRAGPPGSSVVTPAALADATARAEAFETAREDAALRVEEARLRLGAARRAELVAAEEERQRRTELDRLVGSAAQLRREVEVSAASLEERHAALSGRVAALDAEVRLLPEREVEARQALSVVERARDEARGRRAEYERLRVQADALRRDFDMRGAAVEERRSVLGTRLAEIEARLAARPDEEAAARARRTALEARRAAIEIIASRLHERTAEIEALAERLRARRREQSEAAREAGRRLDGLRNERNECEKQLAELRERASRLEVEEAELRLRLEQAVENVRREFDCEPDAAVAAPVPEVPEGTTLPGRARELERELRLMGPINPLALSEYEALLERHEFLQQQLDDVKNTRRELTRVIKTVDEEIVRVFDGAFSDVSRNFSELFGMLFPGGSGRLVLSNPEDLLNTGIEMEARPSGKMVRRLSLLSGGERSLAALAYLFSVFRARPSPFYLMDEVEAALDDVNLHRFLDLVHEFRNEAQLLIVSHQKRTMEAADVLYGVSMPPGGSSRVVSQRMSDLTFEEAPA